MSNSRDQMLQTIRHAVAQGVRTSNQAIRSSQYEQRDRLDEAERVLQFAHRVEEYKAWVGQCAAHEVAAVIGQRLTMHGYRSLVIPHDFEASWYPIEVQLIKDIDLTAEQIASSDGVLSTCALGIAQTGTIVLDAGVGQGRRMLTLLPDYHCCVVPASAIVGTVPEAFAMLEPTVQARRSPMTFISGPSATSDIELNRVEGVHGPRTLDVIIVRDK